MTVVEKLDSINEDNALKLLNAAGYKVKENNYPQHNSIYNPMPFPNPQMNQQQNLYQLPINNDINNFNNPQYQNQPASFNQPSPFNQQQPFYQQQYFNHPPILSQQQPFNQPLYQPSNGPLSFNQQQQYQPFNQPPSFNQQQYQPFILKNFNNYDKKEVNEIKENKEEI